MTSPRRAFSRSAVALALAAASVVSLAPEARGDTPPSSWEKVKQPRLASRYALHLEVRALMASDDALRASSRNLAGGETLERARRLLEARRDEVFTDARLLFDYGEILENLGRHREAADVLEKGLALAPARGEGVTEARLVLSYAYAKSDRPREERDAYIAYLSDVVDERGRMTATLNLAEAEMRLGNLQDAVAGYEDTFNLFTIRMERSRAVVDTEALAHYGLAVALDRRGDTSGSKRAIERAVALDTGLYLITRDPKVFYVPSYERNWYVALAVAHLAAAAPRGEERTARQRELVTVWGTYVRDAHPEDRWLAQAKRHLAAARRGIETSANAR